MFSFFVLSPPSQHVDERRLEVLEEVVQADDGAELGRRAWPVDGRQDLTENLSQPDILYHKEILR
jgi:hypothetical protein